jgi:small redox-active disulfide protein 2
VGEVHTIQVLGPGCRRCEILAANAEKAILDLGLDARVEKVSDLASIASMGVLSTPGLVVDGEVKVTGRLLTVRQLRKLLADL